MVNFSESNFGAKSGHFTVPILRVRHSQTTEFVPDQYQCFTQHFICVKGRPCVSMVPMTLRELCRDCRRKVLGFVSAQTDSPNIKKWQGRKVFRQKKKNKSNHKTTQEKKTGKKSCD